MGSHSQSPDSLFHTTEKKKKIKNKNTKKRAQAQTNQNFFFLQFPRFIFRFIISDSKKWVPTFMQKLFLVLPLALALSLSLSFIKVAQLLSTEYSKPVSRVFMVRAF